MHVAHIPCCRKSGLSDPKALLVFPGNGPLDALSPIETKKAYGNSGLESLHVTES